MVLHWRRRASASARGRRRSSVSEPAIGDVIESIELDEATSGDGGIHVGCDR